MAKPVGEEDARRGRELAEWRARYPEAWGFELEWDEELGIPLPVTRIGQTPTCGATLRNGEACRNRAGIRTAHEGVGRCFRHDTRVERAAGAWLMAHRIAEVIEVSPWDALLLTVKRAAAWVQFYHDKLAEVTDDDELRPGQPAHAWLEGAERSTTALARFSKMAVDAGVARLLVERAQAEGELIARVLNSAIAEAGLDEGAEDRLRTALRAALLREDTRTASAPLSLGDASSDGEDVTEVD